MARDRRPRSLGPLSVLLAASAVAGVSLIAQAPVAPPSDVTFSKDISRILQRSCKREVVVVDAAEDRDAPVLGYPFLHVIPVSWHVTHDG